MKADKQGVNKLLNFKESFVYPLKMKDGSSQNMHISLYGLFFLVPNPSTPSPHSPSKFVMPSNLKVKTLSFTGKDLR